MKGSLWRSGAGLAWRRDLFLVPALAVDMEVTYTSYKVDTSDAGIVADA
jgi:hypothetical protein